MIRLEHSVVIKRPIEEVFAFVTDFDNLPQWDPAVLEAKITSEGPVGVGTTLREVFLLLGRKVELPGEITEYEPNRKFGFKATSGPMPAEVTMTLEPAGGSTKFTIVAEAEPKGFFRVAEPLVARTLRRQSETNHANLKDLL